jgi:hypothetical protein
MPETQNLQRSSTDCLVSLGNSHFLLLRKDLLLIEHWQALYPLPWSPAGLLGLVQTERGPVPLVGLHGAPALDSLTPKFVLVVQSPKGMLAVAADAIEELAASSPLPAECPDLMQALLTQAGDLQSPPGIAEALNPTTASAPPVEQFLRVRSSTAEVLVRATELQHVGKHTGVQMLRAGEPLHWVVQIEDDLLPARSLGAIYQTDCIGSNEPWCLCPVNTSAQAVLVQDVLGFIEAAPEQVRTLHHAGRATHWLVRAHEAPLEILSLEDTSSEVAGANVVALHAIHPAATAAAPALPRALAGARGALLANAQGALNLAVGPWSLIVPARAVRTVAGRLSALQVSAARRAQALPVLDLRLFLGVPQGPRSAQAESPMATEICLGGRKLLVLSEQVTPANDPDSPAENRAWPSLPALPHALQSLLKSVRIQEGASGKGQCELLLQTHNPRALRHAELRTRLRDAWVGYQSRSQSSR